MADTPLQGGEGAGAAERPGGGGGAALPAGGPHPGQEHPQGDQVSHGYIL